MDKVRSAVSKITEVSPDNAAKTFAKIFQPVANKLGVEISANIRGGGNEYKIEDVAVGNRFRSVDGVGDHAPVGVDVRGYNIHTHALEDRSGHWNDPFSTDDIDFYRATRSVGYVSTPSMRVSDPKLAAQWRRLNE